MKGVSSGEVLWSRAEPQCSANNADLNSGIQTCVSCYSKLAFATVKCVPKEKEKSMISGTEPHPGGVDGGGQQSQLLSGQETNAEETPLLGPFIIDCYWLFILVSF